MERRATIHDATAQKHEAVPGPLFIATIWEDRRILDTHEAESADEAARWAWNNYSLRATVAP